MAVRSLVRRRPVPMAATAAFLAVLAVTAGYVSGLVPGVPKTLPTFVALLEVTAGMFLLTVIAWVVSIVVWEPS